MASLNAQTGPLNISYSMPGAYSNDHVDVFSFVVNPASLAELKENSIGVLAERRFLLAELNNYSIAAAVCTHSGNFGARADYFGFNQFNNSEAALAYGMKLGKKADVGASFNYHAIRIGGIYGNASAIGFETGLIVHLTDKLHTGIHVSNPIFGKYGKNKDEKLATTCSYGIGFESSEKFLVSAELIKEEGKPVTINAGIQYQILSQLSTGIGISTATSSLWFGIGLLMHSIRIDIISRYHPVLGFTPGLMLVFEFKKSTR